ncbi:hypothetical protein [Streptomyces wuyuanensis]|uniref:hypothetical protein n=1 Tax=Streptomyces wuyuanensis TaxID=1196353 RepID=UPI003428ED00
MIASTLMDCSSRVRSGYGGQCGATEPQAARRDVAFCKRADVLEEAVSRLKGLTAS